MLAPIFRRGARGYKNFHRRYPAARWILFGILLSIVVNQRKGFYEWVHQQPDARLIILWALTSLVIATATFAYEFMYVYTSAANRPVRAAAHKDLDAMTSRDSCETTDSGDSDYLQVSDDDEDNVVGRLDMVSDKNNGELSKNSDHIQERLFLAARSGDLEYIQRVHRSTSPPQPWSGPVTFITCAAAEGGQGEVLEWLMSDAGGNCPLAELVCGYAAEKGDMPMLRWLQDNGAPPLDEDVSFCAAKGGQLETFVWLVEVAKCPVDLEDCCRGLVEGSQRAYKTRSVGDLALALAATGDREANVEAEAKEGAWTGAESEVSAERQKLRVYIERQIQKSDMW